MITRPAKAGRVHTTFIVFGHAMNAQDPKASTRMSYSSWGALKNSSNGAKDDVNQSLDCMSSVTLALREVAQSLVSLRC
jgi:hypothetical protein